jgi:hypothetical protein
VLIKRTYWEEQVEERTYFDEHATSDARMYLQCAFMCIVNEEYNEALNWYAMAHKLFCGSQDPATVHTTTGCLWMTCEPDGDWEVHMFADIVTRFGNTTTSIKIADIRTNPTRPGTHLMAIIDRMELLRHGKGGWFEHLEKCKAIHKQQVIDAKGIDFTYYEDEKEETK